MRTLDFGECKVHGAHQHNGSATVCSALLAMWAAWDVLVGDWRVFGDMRMLRLRLPAACVAQCMPHMQATLPRAVSSPGKVWDQQNGVEHLHGGSIEWMNPNCACPAASWLESACT